VKETLRTAVNACLMSTTAACLRRVPWIDAFHVHATFLCLVVYKGEQLRERPAMQFTPASCILAVLAASERGRYTDAAQVLKHDGCSYGRILRDAF
jgi:hypothetical protein